MDKKVTLAAALAGFLSPQDLKMAEILAATQEAKYGIRARVGQFTRAEKDASGNPIRVDMSEHVNFNRSRYIPGNGPSHRLGRNRSAK